MARPVLLVTHSGDFYTIDRVADAVSRRGRTPLRFDSDLHPVSSTLTLAGDDGLDGTLVVDGARTDVRSLSAVWIRRVWTGRSLQGRVDDRFLGACVRDARSQLRALFFALEPHVPVVSSLERTIAAEEKPHQLRIAASLGLNVPPTIVTNNPDDVRAFFAAHDGKIITKLLGALSQTMDASGDFLYTSRVSRDDLNDMTGLRFMPQIFQREITKKRELRVVVVGTRVFAGALTPADPHVGVDWRMQTPGENVQWTKTDVDIDVAKTVVKMVRELGLDFGAFDFVEDEEGALHFLELNPAGEWGFLERDCAHPISDAIADVLVGVDQ